MTVANKETGHVADAAGNVDGQEATSEMEGANDASTIQVRDGQDGATSQPNGARLRAGESIVGLSDLPSD